MSALRAPGLGPIIGHTTSTSCRLWIRAEDPEDEGVNLASERRTVGVIGIVHVDPKDERKKTVRDAWYFRLQREFDRTGTFVLGKDVALGQHEYDRAAGEPPGKLDKTKPLAPDTEYIVRMATLSLDDPQPDNESLSDRQLAAQLPPIENIKKMLLELPAEKCEARVRTFPPSGKPIYRLSFLMGSCRYPGFLWKIREADRIFKPMARMVAPSDSEAVRFTLMVGDQIYADMLNKALPILRADTYAEFQSRYREALGSPNMRQLLRSAPVYMMLDDHEIEDNWSQDQIHDQAKQHLFNVAIGAYMSYQWSHGPRTWGRLLYYHFECGGYPFFVLDTRTQRYRDDAVGLDDNHLLGRPAIDPAHPGQLQRFLTWLAAQRRDVPKFVVSASVFAPNDMTERADCDDATAMDDFGEVNRERRDASDSWPAYPNTRRAILDLVASKGIQNLVFLTGDIHCSNIARMRFIDRKGKDRGLCAYDITSSAFYWPFPFADGDPNNYVHDSAAPGQRDPFPAGDGVMHYRAWAFTQEDNSCRITVDKSRHELRVEYFDRDGEVIPVTSASVGTGSDPALVKMNRLPLAPWK